VDTEIQAMKMKKLSLFPNKRGTLSLLFSGSSLLSGVCIYFLLVAKRKGPRKGGAGPNARSCRAYAQLQQSLQLFIFHYDYNPIVLRQNTAGAGIALSYL
jgi:hypothetical protein